MQLDILTSVRSALAKKNYLTAIMLLKNYLTASGSPITAGYLTNDVAEHQRYGLKNESYYLDTVATVIERYLNDIEMGAGLGFKVSDATPEHAPTSVTSAYEAMEIWLLAPKSSLGNLSADLIRHCNDVAQSLEALGLFEACDEFNLIAVKAGRPGANQAELIEKATALFNQQVLPLIKELQEPLGEEALKRQALSQTATLKDIGSFIDILPKGPFKAALKDIIKSPKSETARIILAKQTIQNPPM